MRGREFLETVESKFLGQHVTEATHFRGHILDLVMSSCENMVVGVEHQGRLGSSDHEILMCTLAADFLREDNHTMVRDFGRANFEAMKNDLRIDWWDWLEGKNRNEMWICIREKIQESIIRHIPWKRRKEKNRPKWMTRKIKRSINKKRELWHRAKTGGLREKAEYKKLEK